MQRRTFIQRALLAGTVCALPTCQRGITKAQVLRALVEQVVLPSSTAMARNSRRLENEITRLAAEPGLNTLRSAREQWQRALLSWKRAEAFHNGPIMDTNSLLRAMFWPVRPDAIDALLQSSQAVDAASIDAIGVDRRGLFALEHLLYSAEADEQMVIAFTGPTGERRARLARSLAGNVALYAEQVARALGDGKKYAGQFADGGQDSVNRLVGQLVRTVEQVSASRLARISGLAKSGRLKAAEVEGSGGGMSQQIVLTYLRASEELYLGVDCGLSQLVKALSSTVDAGLRSAFSQAIAAVADLRLPLEEVAQHDPAALDAAAAAAKTLERALRTDLASSLGVTLSFSSVDGD